MTEQSTDKQQFSSKNNKKIWCRRLLCGLSAVIIGFIFILIVTLSTSTGQVALIKLTDKLMDSLSIEDVSGGLQEGLLLNNLHYQTDGVEVLIAQTRLQLALHCLWRGKVCLQDLSLTKPYINIDTALLPPSEPETPSSNEPMQPIHLPISIQADNLTIEQLLVKIDQQQISLATLQSAVTLNNEFGLTLEPTDIVQLQFHQQLLPLTELDIEQKQTASEPINWEQLKQQLQQPLLAGLTEIQLPFAIHIVNIEGSNWYYQQTDGEQILQQITIPKVQLQADATGYQVELQKFIVESSLGDLNATGQIQLDQDFPLNFHIHSTINEIKNEQQILLANSEINLALSGHLLKQTELKLTTTGGVATELVGQVQLNQAKTPFYLTFNSPNFRYPATGKDPLITKQVELIAQGDILDYQMNLKGNAQGMGIPVSDLLIAIKGGLSQATLEQIQLKTLGGSLEVNGQLDWENGLKWQNDVAVKQINTASLLPNWRALLSGQVSTNGYVNNEDWHMDIQGLSLQGRINGQPLGLSGNLTANKTAFINIPDFKLTYGNNNIQAQGHLGQQSDFKLVLDAPNLAGLLPDFSAGLVGHIDINGDISEPELIADLKGSNIRFQQFRLANIQLTSQIHTQQQIQGELAINLNQFNMGDIALHSAQLHLTGNEQQHQLTLRSQGDPVGLNLAITGQFSRQQESWQGKLSDINVSSPIGQITTNQAIEVNYNNLDILATISPHCWQNPKVELCFAQPFNVGERGEVHFSIPHLNLTMVNDIIKQADLLQGQLTSQGQVSWSNEQPLFVELQVDSNSLRLNQKIDYRTFTVDIDKLSLNTKLADNNFNLFSHIHLANNGSLNTDIQINDITQNRGLAGSLQLTDLRLSLLDQLLTRGDSINGELNANLRFGGNLQAPLLNGNINLEDLKLAMMALPVPINNGQLSLQFNGNSSRLEGMIESQDNNRLELTGNANWQDLDRWTAEVSAKANEFAVDIPNMARLRISPDIQISATPTLLNLSGEVNIPWARISIEQLPESAVSVSSDEVILDETTVRNMVLPNQAAQQNGMLIQSDLRINIGNNVLLDAYGLKTGLQGILSVRQEKGNLGLYGQINLVNGRYSSFGQDLLIRKGQISFSGLPSQPLLNIEAIRNPDVMEDTNVTAGVKVVGLVDSPEVTIFAEPSMSQAQALSYLLTGRSLENSGEGGSGSSVGAALLGLGLTKSGKLIGGIGETFGIQDLSLGTQGIGDSSQVVVSGYITPRLQVKYGMGLFDGLAEFTVRYRLLPRLYFQSVSGVNQAFDLLYQFEF